MQYQDKAPTTLYTYSLYEVPPAPILHNVPFPGLVMGYNAGIIS